MDPVILSKSLAAASANCIAQSQSLAAAGNLVLNGGSVVGGVATLDSQRRVQLISGGNDSGLTFTFYGSNESGQRIQQAVAGSNAGTIATDLDFLTVGTVYSSGSIASTVTVGTNTTGSTAWKNPNIHLTPFNLDIENFVTGTVTYNTEFTMDDYFTPAKPTNVPRVRATIVNAATAATSIAFTSAVRGWRETITAGTGTVTAEAIQAGIVNY